MGFAIQALFLQSVSNKENFYAGEEEMGLSSGW